MKNVSSECVCGCTLNVRYPCNSQYYFVLLQNIVWDFFVLEKKENSGEYLKDLNGGHLSFWAVSER